MKELWSDPVWRSVMTQKLRSAKANPSARAAIRSRLIQQWDDPDWRAKQEIALHQDYVRKIQQEKSKRYWADPAWRARQLAIYRRPETIMKNQCACQAGPNKLEQKILSEFSEKLRYVGNRTWWRTLPNGKTKNPDFKVRGQNKIIEIFGDYWHKNDEPQELIDQYKQGGIDCLVVWEKEILNNMPDVTRRVNTFVEKEIT